MRLSSVKFIFTVIFTVILQFSFFLAESNRRSQELVDIDRNILFIQEHLKISTNQYKEVDEAITDFDDANGVLNLISADDSTIEYNLVNRRIQVTRDNNNTNFISFKAFNISSFRINRINNNNVELEGITINLEIQSNNNVFKRKSFNFNL